MPESGEKSQSEGGSPAATSSEPIAAIWAPLSVQKRSGGIRTWTPAASARSVNSDHFAEGEAPNPPFICYLLPGSDNFSADGRVYYKINEVHIELYCDSKDPALEATLEAVLDEHGIFYNKTEVWIESEKLYEVLYTFEMEV